MSKINTNKNIINPWNMNLFLGSSISFKSESKPNKKIENKNNIKTKFLFIIKKGLTYN